MGVNPWGPWDARQRVANVRGGSGVREHGSGSVECAGAEAGTWERIREARGSGTRGTDAGRQSGREARALAYGISTSYEDYAKRLVRVNRLNGRVAPCHRGGGL